MCPVPSCFVSMCVPTAALVLLFGCFNFLLLFFYLFFCFPSILLYLFSFSWLVWFFSPFLFSLPFPRPSFLEILIFGSEPSRSIEPKSQSQSIWTDLVKNGSINEPSIFQWGEPILLSCFVPFFYRRLLLLLLLLLLFEMLKTLIGSGM